MASSSSSSATIREARRYDVFLSFRGEDTRNGFISHLYEALCKNQILTFIDNNLERGDDIYPSLLAVIEESTISLIIFSESYADSKWCLKELAKILQCRKLNGQIVIPVFYGVDPSHIKNQTGKFGLAFDKLKERLREGEMDLDLDDVRSHLKEAANISGWNSHNRPESELIKSIVGCILNKFNLCSNKRQRAMPDVLPIDKRQRTMPDVLPIVAEVEVPMGDDNQQTRESSSLTKRPVGDAFKRNEEKIWSWLMDDQVLRVGIYGMGGVGKTTLMRHIQTHLKGQSSLKVFWVTISQDFSIWKLQDLIAKKIDLQFKDKEDEVERAEKLTKSLKAKGKYVLILDDLWNYVELDKVGIPVGVNPCKLVFTTRKLEVCRQMDCSERNTIQVQCLSEEEAWILFTQELGNYNTEVEELVKAVSRECAGLPLGIRVMARSMKGICNVHTWRNMLEELKESNVSKGHEMREKVFSVLKVSYLHLNDPALQECLSYCALFPEDAKVNINELIEYMIVEGIIDAKKSRRAELDRGHTMLDTLQNACLLEGDTENVWMHDLIRDMLIIELREGSKVLVEAGAQLKELPDVVRWTEKLVRVSLMKNDVEMIPSSHAPRCPNLSTLLLCGNRGLRMIADSFFEQFQRLKVLDLSGCGWIEELPRSISNLVNLTALLLRECGRLTYVPSLAKLEKLKKLDLRRCERLKQMPEGVRFLLNLKYLDLSESGIEEIGSGILPMLSRLQVLKLCNDWRDSKLSIRASEVRELRMLETLHCRFSNVREVGECMPNVFRTKRVVGDAFGAIVEKIWSWLMDDQVLRVGICGLGGVGKTTVMRYIQNRLKGQSSLKVFWVTASRDFNIWKLQDLIAKKIDLKFLDKEDEVERAEKLTQTLKAKGECVLILDDLWNNVELDKVGIPVGVNMCKLVLTSRSVDVCRQMDCSEWNIIHMQCLSKEEAWILFTQELGNYKPEAEELVKAVLWKCAGLPLGIRVMARSMKGICNVHTWRNTLEELKMLAGLQYNIRKDHKMWEVFFVLTFCFLHLTNPALQECLSYCALFPEDEKIDRNELIEYMIVEGIIDERESRQAELDKGHTMLDTLENACLLEGDTENVWMHDLIRDMVILQLRERSNTLVEAGAQLKELPDVERWTENLVRVSLMSNDIEEIPSRHAPRCPNLSTLLLCRNRGLRMIADSFFEQFQGLKVLDLSWCDEIEELPRSISDLVNLTALLLCGCRSLIHVPSLAKLEKLKKLDLGLCWRLKQMPEGVRFLLNLKYIDLSRSGIEERGSGIPMLSRLQVLKLCNGWGDSKLSIRASDVGELRMLETLHCKFSNVREFEEYMKSRERSQQSPNDHSIFMWLA